MPLISSFSEFQTNTTKEFLEKGYTVQSCENIEGLKQFRKKIAEWFCEKTSLPPPTKIRK